MMQKHKFVIFDLDDTLYKEIDYLKSAFREIALFLEAQSGLNNLYDEMIRYYQQGLDVFLEILNTYHIQVEKEKLIDIYRKHKPNIRLDDETSQVLEVLSKASFYELGLITDGRFVSQMNKINALGLKKYIKEENILILEETRHQKPNEYAFRLMEERHNDFDFIYVGDNPKKDFLAPNRLGWSTICLINDGRNIHKQDNELFGDYLPKKRINSLSELKNVIS